MNIRFLGTGASEGLPGVFCLCETCTRARREGGRDIRHRCAAQVDDGLLIDLPPDIFSQSLKFGLELGRFHTLLVTHTHYDHFYPAELRNMRPPYVGQSDIPTLIIYGSAEVGKALHNALSEENMLRRNMTPMDEQVRFHELAPLEEREIGSYRITPLPARHCPGAYLYLIKGGGRTLLYGTDTGYFPEETWDYLLNEELHMAVLDCNSPTENVTPNHMCIDDNVSVKRRLYQQRSVTTRTRFVATHFSHSGLTHQELEERMRHYGITVAYDGLSLRV